MKWLKQVNTGKTWGYVTQVSAQATVVITMLNMFMLAATFFQTTFSVWLLTRGIMMSFWSFLLMLGFGLLIMAVILYKYAVPSYFSAFNDQFYRHDNQLRRDIEAIKEQNDCLVEMIEELRKVK